MTRPPKDRPDPFFIGDHLALDFLNTLTGDGTEWLTNGADLVDWLEKAGAIDRAAAAKFRNASDRKRLDATAARARALRDWLRGFLRKHAGERAGSKLPTDLAPLNALLAEEDSYAKIRPHAQADGHSHLSRRARLALERPRAVVATRRRRHSGSHLQRGSDAGARLRGACLHPDVSRPHQIACAALVQHGRLRQSRQGRRAPRESARRGAKASVKAGRFNP